MKKTSIFMASMILASLTLFVMGCGSKIKTYTIEGAITYEGKPVAGGVVDFTPNAEQGNSGPGCIADIENGKYKTREKRGIVGGAYIATIYGTDGTVPKNMDDDTSAFPPYILPITLPEKGGTLDIAIPSEGGRFEKVKKTAKF